MKKFVIAGLGVMCINIAVANQNQTAEKTIPNAPFFKAEPAASMLDLQATCEPNCKPGRFSKQKKKP